MKIQKPLDKETENKIIAQLSSIDTPATGTISGSTRSARGGFPFEPSDSRCSVDDRSGQNPNVRDCRYGFRVVRNAALRVCLAGFCIEDVSCVLP